MAGTVTSARPSILFLTYSHNTWGGIEIWLDGLARSLAEHRWNVTIGLARGVQHNRPAAYREQWPGHQFVEIDGRTGTNEGRILAIMRMVKRLEPDVVVAVTLGHALAAVGRMKQHGSKVRLVLPLHATHPVPLREAMAFEPVLDRCVGVNPLHAEALARHGFPRERLATVINGATPPRSSRSRLRAPGTPLRLLWAGRLDQVTKRIFDLVPLSLALLRRGVSFHLTVAGDGPDATELRRRVTEAGLADRVELVGRVEHERLREEILPDHDVLLITSPVIGEAGPPLIALEAMAAGTVPVSSEFIGVHAPGSIREGETALLFECEDVEGAASRVADLFTDAALWKRLSDGCRERAQNFTLDASLRGWEETLRVVATAPPLTVSRHARFPLAARDRASGRLEASALPPAAIDALRRLMRRFPRFSDGWGEWPGNVTPGCFVDREFTHEELAAVDRELAATRE